MKDFGEFLQLLAENEQKEIFDTSFFMGDAWSPQITLTKEDVSLIVKLSHLNTVAILRQYHGWMQD